MTVFLYCRGARSGSGWSGADRPSHQPSAISHHQSSATPKITPIITMTDIRPAVGERGHRGRKKRRPAQAADANAAANKEAAKPQSPCERWAAAAVAASCAMPYVFAPIRIDNEVYCDGGAVDRVQAVGWRSIRPQIPAIVHIVDRSHGAAQEEGIEGSLVLRSPRSGANFFSLGNFQGQRR